MIISCSHSIYLYYFIEDSLGHDSWVDDDIGCCRQRGRKFSRVGDLSELDENIFCVITNNDDGKATKKMDDCGESD